MFISICPQTWHSLMWKMTEMKPSFMNCLAEKLFMALLFCHYWCCTIPDHSLCIMGRICNLFSLRWPSRDWFWDDADLVMQTEEDRGCGFRVLGIRTKSLIKAFWVIVLEVLCPICYELYTLNHLKCAQTNNAFVKEMNISIFAL